MSNRIKVLASVTACISFFFLCMGFATLQDDLFINGSLDFTVTDCVLKPGYYVNNVIRNVTNENTITQIVVGDYDSYITMANLEEDIPWENGGPGGKNIEVGMEDGRIRVFVNESVLYILSCGNQPVVFNEDSSTMFNNLGITSIEFNSINTKNVKNMSQMFRCCRALNTLNLLNFNTENVTDMSRMFEECWKIKEIDFSSFNTSKVKTMKLMFYDCEALTSLDLSKFNTPEVEDMSQMFQYCIKLTELDISEFDTSNVKNMSQMFRACRVLNTLNLSNFNTENVTDMSSMFEECWAINNLNISSFDTQNVTSMSNMFAYCSQKLRILDISSFDTSKVTNMSNMFLGNYSLVTIYVGDDWNTDEVIDGRSEKMFSGCFALTGGNGTQYIESHIDKEYARIDTVDNPGYFTKKSAS